LVLYIFRYLYNSLLHSRFKQLAKMNSQTTLPPLTDEEANLLGNKIYPAVEALVVSPSVAGKIVGMLIELKFDPSHDDLRGKVIECLEVLKNHRPVDDPRLEELSVLSRHILAKLVPESVSGLPEDSCGLYAFDRKSCTGACQKKHNAYFVSTDPRIKKVCKFFPFGRCGRRDCWASHNSIMVFEDDVCVPPAVASVPPPVVAVEKIPMHPAIASVPPPVVAVEKIPMPPAVASVPPPVAVANDSKGYITFCFLYFSDQGCGCEIKNDQKHNAQEFMRVGAKCPKLFTTATDFLKYKGLTLNVPGVQAKAPPPAPARVPAPAVAKITKPPAPARVPAPAVAKITKPPAPARVPRTPVAVADDSKGYIAFCFLYFSDQGCGCEIKNDQKHNVQEFMRVGAKCPKLFTTATDFLKYKGLTLNVPGVQANAPPPAPARVPRQPVVAPARVPQQSVAADGGGGGIVDRPVYCFAGLSAGQCFLRGCTGCHDRARFDLDCASSSGLRNAFKNFENGAKKKAVKT
jgi:hypothetical protein